MALDPLQLRLVRTLDVVLAAIGLCVLLPLFLFIAGAIKMEDGGPVFYGHSRIGKNFQPLRVWKFRTMVCDADRIGGDFTVLRDPRITRCGRYLRAYKLDELPQLFNVVTGSMRLVGARPETLRCVQMFKREYSELLTLPPGITDPASIAFRNESAILTGSDPEKLYLDRVLPAKLTLSLDYARRRTVVSDFVTIVRTIFPVSRRSENLPPGFQP